MLRYRYLRTGAAMIRVNRWSIDALPTTPSESRARVLDDPDLSLAIRLAAPGLIRWLRRSEREPSEASVTKNMALHRYVTRALSRPTPFGLFVAVGTIPYTTAPGARRPVVDSERIDVHVRPDLGLVARLADEVQSDLVRTNDLVRAEGGRLRVDAAHTLSYAKRDEASIRATPAVRSALRAARTPLSVDDLVTAMVLDYRGVPEQRIRGMVEHLVQLGFLTRAPRPVLTYRDYAPSTMFGVALEPDEGALFNAVMPGRDRDRLNMVLHRSERRMTEHQLDRGAVDVHVRLADAAVTGSIPAAVGDQIADAVTFLTRVAPAAGDGSLHNQRAVHDHHDAFLERFGFGNAVRVQDLLDPLHELAKTPVSSGVRDGLSSYEEVLRNLIDTALVASPGVIDIDDAIEERLVAHVPHGAAAQPPHPSIDVFVQLGWSEHEGVFAVLNHLPVTDGGTASGRFRHVLPEQYAEVPPVGRDRELIPGAPEIEVDVSYVPVDPRMANVAVSPGRGDLVVPINTSDGGAPSVALEDLWVVSDYERLLVWSRSLGREVYVTQSHMLTAQVAPDVAQFLLQIASVRRRALGGFSWGPFEESPHLPRLTRRGVVLRAAQWTLTRALCPPDEHFESSFTTWRSLFDLPRWVYEVQDDNRLLLDATSTVGLDHIRGRLRDASTVRFHEVLPAPQNSLLTDHTGRHFMSEVVVPVALTETASSRGAVEYTASEEWARVVAPHFVEDPLEVRAGWLAYDVYQPTALNLEVARAVMELVRSDAGSDSFGRWYFVQYRDSRPHLRVRLELRDDADPAVASGLVHDLHQLLRATKTSSDIRTAPYRPEYGRYLPPEHFTLAEDLFAAESELACILASERTVGHHRMAVAVAVVDEYARRFLPELAPRIRLAETAEPSEGARTFVREQRRLLLSLLQDEHGSLEGESELVGRCLREFMSVVGPVLDQIREALGVLPDATAIEPRVEGVLRSLQHMACNRILRPGVDLESDVMHGWALALRNVRGRAAFAARARTNS